MDKDSKIYVTGHKGMVGKSVVKKLKENNYSNIIGKESSELDLRNQREVKDYFSKEKPDYVIHLAARVGGIAANIRHPAEFLYDNVMINSNVINSAYENDVKKLLFLGSSCIYPKHCEQPMKEEHLLTGKFEPTNEGYALSKVLGIKLCQYYNEQFDTNFISLIPPNMYGIHEKFDSEESHVIAALIMKIYEAKKEGKESVEIWGSGKARREFLYVEDIAEAILFFMKNFDSEDLGSFINVGYGKEIKIKELAELICEVVGFKGSLETNPEKPEGMKRKILDSSKAFELGWSPETSLREGLENTYEWFLEQNT